MTLDEMRDVFAAFSTLSDADEALEAVATDTCRSLIRHAKAHLGRILESNPELERAAIVATSLSCPLWQQQRQAR